MELELVAFSFNVHRVGEGGGKDEEHGDESARIGELRHSRCTLKALTHVVWSRCLSCCREQELRAKDTDKT